MEEKVRPECEKDWPKIYVKTDEKPKTVRNLLPLLFDRYTMDSLVLYKGAETYSDKECQNIQCYKGRYRSFDDIYACCKTYFPAVTPKEVLYELLTLDIPGYTNKDFPLFIRLSYCATIKRIRVWFTNFPHVSIKEVDSFKGESVWDWKTLLEMLDLSMQYKEIYDYIKKEKLKNKTDGN